ncbi:MAG TPA: alpha-2-macroglobulin [Terriglobia bacterium]|nr:alpha-2-macroglobulin [Terriglobia bacterium]
MGRFLALRSALARSARFLLSRISWLFHQVFGHWNWQAPSWAAWTGRQGTRFARYLAADRKRAGAVLIVLVALIGGFLYYRSLPKPHYVEYIVVSPPLTVYDEKQVAQIRPMRVEFAEPVAPLKDIERAVTAGITVSPAIAGTWFWVSDHELQLTPRDDWPIDATYKVRIASKGFLADAVHIEDYSFKFATAPFTARITDSQFYQDPRDPNLKKLVATIQFSHPVDPTQFEMRVSLSLAGDAAYLGLKPDSRNFTVIYDKLKLAAHIHSAALAMPRDDTPMTLKLDSGVRAARGGNDTPDKLEAVVTIPGRTSLRFSDARMTLVDNAKYEPEQVMLLKSSSPVAEKGMTGKVTTCVLPERHPNQPKEDLNPYRWTNESEIGNEFISRCESLALTYVPSEEGGNTSHGFKFKGPVGRYIYAVVKDGVEGTGGYISGKPYVATFVVEPYRKALTFLGQGALLSLTGDRKIGFMARDVDRVEVEVGRLMPSQLQHLASSMWDYSHPRVGEDLEGRIVERFSANRDFSGKEPGKPSYDSVDLSPYLQDKTGKHGLFFLHLRSLPARPRPGVNSYRTQPGEVEDERLILVTDLGFVVKQAKDGSRTVFVQSIRTGDPVTGARVEVIGRNGDPVMASATDAGGRAQFPKFPDTLKREKSPLFLVVQKDDDFSFLAFRTNGRQLDMSRFDTGGVENAESTEQLSSYIFSDRGIYRPGETTHLGLVTRTADWKSSLTGLPIDVEITDSRGTIVNRSSMKLSPLGFDEIAYTTQPAAPTGAYEVSAYLVRDERRRDLLGSSSFKVQEFEPDRMKVRLTLSDQPIPGWLKPDDVKARIEALHLFGEPASARRVEGEMSLTPVLPEFSRYKDYRFQIGERLPEPYHEALAPSVTDDKGAAEFKLDLGRFVGRAYRLNVLARAFEAEGGRNVAAQDSVIVSEAPYLVGVKPDGDLGFVKRASARQANWLAVNQQLDPVAADGLTLEWVQRKYVSVLTQQDNQTYQYVSKLKEIVRDTKSVKIASGGTNLAIPTDEPGEFVLVLRNAAGSELNRLNYSVAGQANVSRSLERNAELQVQLDKASYLGGDTVEVSIRAPYVGAGLITIERERVYHYQWFKTTTTSSVQRITLPRDFEGNGYVTVQFLRDPASDELFLSPLSYGVAPFAANLSERTQTVTATAPAVVKPGTTMTIHLSTAETSRVAVLAVDEGILQVARYKNPDPLGYFFQKKMLEVNSTQILDLILPDFKRFLALAAPGGDADGGFSRHLNPFAKKRKPPVAYWSGLIDVGPGGRDVQYTVPDYFNGKLRIVAIAVNARRVGVSEVDTEVKGDFILTPNVPEMVAPGDEFTVSVGVFNNTVFKAANGATAPPIQVDVQVSGGLVAVGPSRLDLQIADKKEGVAEYRFKANPVLGAASLKFVARRGTSEARMDESISVRPPVAYRTSLTLGRFDGSKNETPLTRDLYSDQRKVEAAVSSLPLVWGQGLLAYLNDYPYYCTEQIVSKGVGALMITSRPEFGQIKGKETLADLYSALQSRQNDEGGFGLWTSSPETAEFASVYAAHFLIESREKGQKVPPEVLLNVNNWLTRMATTPASTLEGGRLRAYAVYLLVRQGIKPTAAISNVEQELTHRYEKTWQTDLAAAYLASAYRLMQRNDEADRIIKNVPWSQQKRDWNGEVYYAPVGHDAQLLYLLARHFPNRLSSVPQAVLDGIGKTISGNDVNSLSAAYTLLALDAYAKTAASTVKLGISEITRDNRERALTLPAGSMPRIGLSEAAAKVQFSKDGALPAYFQINESGFDRNVPTAGISQGIEIIREFVDAKENVISQVKVGQEFFVRVRIRTTTRDLVQQIAVVDLLPGGVEAVLELQPPADSSTGFDPAAAPNRATRPMVLPIGVPVRSNWMPQHVDVRDDRIVMYGDATRSQETFVYRVRATNAGIFQAPPAFAEGMYDRKVTGMGLAGKLEIVKP